MVESLLLLAKSEGGRATMGEIRRKLGVSVDRLRDAAALMVEDGRVTFERGSTPDSTVFVLEDTDPNQRMLCMLAALQEKRDAAARA